MTYDATPSGVLSWVLDRLAAQPNLQVFSGMPDDATPALGYGAGQRDIIHDPDGRAHMYAAVYVGPGWRDPSGDGLCATVAGPLTLTFQVTAAGGDQDRCLRACGKVMAALDRQAAPGGGVVRLSLAADRPLVDRDPTPSRTYVPVMGTVHLP